MSLNIEELEIKPAPASVKKPTRKGRGNASGFGGECGRGHKGQKSRSGFSRGSGGFEGGQNPLYRRLPKLSGFKSFKAKYVMINFDQLEERFPSKSNISLEDLIEARLIRINEIVKISGTNIPKRKWVLDAEIALTSTARQHLESIKSS